MQGKVLLKLARAAGISEFIAFSFISTRDLTSCCGATRNVDTAFHAVRDGHGLRPWHGTLCKVAVIDEPEDWLREQPSSTES